MKRPWRLRYLRGIGWRYVRPDGIEHRCHQCNNRLSLISGRCPICRRS